MRGSVIKFDKQRLRGCILRDDRRKVPFDKASLDGLNTRLLSVGDKVEFQEHSVGVFRARNQTHPVFYGFVRELCRASETRSKRIAPKDEARNTVDRMTRVNGIRHEEKFRLQKAPGSPRVKGGEG